MPDFSIEKQFTDPVIGLDEVGRGPLAGPVISCGCYFKNYTTQEDFYNLIGDSKKLTEKKRKISFIFLQNLKKEGIIDYHLGIANVQEIDKLDENYSIVSNISNNLSQSMRHKLNNKMKSEYKFSCKKCGYQTISFSWQCPTCKSWESSTSINFLKAI